MVESLVVIMIVSFLSLIFSMIQKWWTPVIIFQIVTLVLTAYLLIRIRVKISRAEKEKLRAKIEELEKKIESLGKKQE
ncbi:MAG: hypothetical protein ABIL22_08600 [candidate division WOR-3 bacterium]